MAINQHYNVGCGVCLGVFHIIFGLGSCGCGIAAFAISTLYYEIAVGMWAGICFYLVTGILGLVSSTRNSCVITAYYIMSLLSTFVAMGQMGWYAYTTYLVIVDCNRYHDSDYEWFFTCTYWLNSSILAGTASFIGFLEWIMSMSSACASCSCCCGNSRTEPEPQTVMIHTIPAQVPPPQQYMTQPGGVMSVFGPMQPQVPQPQVPQPQPIYMPQPSGSKPVFDPTYHQPAPVYTKNPNLMSGGMSVSDPMPLEQPQGAVSGDGPAIVNPTFDLNAENRSLPM